MAKDCPDRRHSSMMKGKFKGKQSYMLEYHDNVPHFHEDLYVYMLVAGMARRARIITGLKRKLG